VLQQARSIASFTGIHGDELSRRRDLRSDTTFTIDSEDAKDLDDAISLKRLGENWELGVHIADVSYYVTPKSPLDLEALNRGTSVYYADSVVPMLPKELSNGICSLNPGEDRLAFSAFIRLSGDGEILSYSFEKTVIRSHIKGIYSEINSLLENAAEADIKSKYAGIEETLKDMRTFAGVLTKKRYGRGGIDLDSVETKITVDPDGRARSISPRTLGASELMIEEFMLTANEAAADYALALGLPFVFRVHESPSDDKLGQLYEVLDSLGISHPRIGKDIRPGMVAAILRQAKDGELSPIVNTMVLRSMAKAKYSPGNIGHFGLALKKYAHFTSPIRRYPDLVIHRILSAYLTEKSRPVIEKRFAPFVAEASAHSADREIAAMNAERDCEACYIAEHMAKYIGDEFDGVIISATAFGAYVRLDNTAEGLVRLSDFPAGDWNYDSLLTFKESRTGKRIRLGDKVRVKISGTNVSGGQIDMVFCG